MSGGCFPEVQVLKKIAKELDVLIENNYSDEVDFCGDVGNFYSHETIQKFHELKKELLVMYKKINAVDYLLCGDYSEKTFNSVWEDTIT